MYRNEIVVDLDILYHDRLLTGKKNKGRPTTNKKNSMSLQNSGLSSEMSDDSKEDFYRCSRHLEQIPLSGVVFVLFLHFCD